MLFLEMSRDELHGGGGWGYLTCLWVPTRKKNGGSWPFWSKILSVKEGDTVVHLRGIGDEACFEGYSTASGDGYETSERPPSPGGWDFSKKFFRADLRDFVPFEAPISLPEVFALRRTELKNYFDQNKARRTRQNIFYVWQAGRLQCLNGAYLSDLDGELFAALFGIDFQEADERPRPTFVSVRTGQQLSNVITRIGQPAFSREIRAQYNGRCCFPSCRVTDSRFLVGSHIARWSDAPELRGHLGNGLCLCLMHDKAFELGLFTLDASHRVMVSPLARSNVPAIGFDLAQAHGKPISLGTIPPMVHALERHWKRIGCEPKKWE